MSPRCVQTPDIIQVCRWLTISGPQSQTPGLSEPVETFSMPSSPPSSALQTLDVAILRWIGLALVTQREPVSVGMHTQVS